MKQNRLSAETTVGPVYEPLRVFKQNEYNDDRNGLLEQLIIGGLLYQEMVAK